VIKWWDFYLMILTKEVGAKTREFSWGRHAMNLAGDRRGMALKMREWELETLNQKRWKKKKIPLPLIIKNSLGERGGTGGSN